MAKHDDDNHSNPLNPNNDAYWESRGYGEGELLRSGEIREVIQYQHRWLIRARGHDGLVIVNFAPGGRQALMHLIDLYQTAKLAQSSRLLQ
ncbi:hypothetical protein NGA35_15905 [Pseudomonas stutzeri]|nr:hypothetical protein [Stutzerimonas stutzeri]